MRVKQPEPFDPNREYKPGERCVYRGMVLIAEIWMAADARLANNNPAIFTQRCVRCKIQREDCPGIGRQCDKYNESYVMINFKSYRAKSAFMLRFGFGPDDKVIPGEMFSDMVERVE
nr:MAG: hypothetical protein [Bacteriophage sp.]